MNSPERNPALAPLEKFVTVPWSTEDAFRRFTVGIDTWWPKSTHSVGGDKVTRVAIDARVGGDVYEEGEDGKISVWGTILVWDEPNLVSFTWHPGRDAKTAQTVEVRFRATAEGAVVDLVHDGWEQLGEKGAEARANYDAGWEGVLEHYTAQK